MKATAAVRKGDGTGQFNGSTSTKPKAPKTAPAPLSAPAAECLGRRPALKLTAEKMQILATLTTGVASAADVAARRSIKWHKKENDPYKDSPFYELKQMPSKAKGAEFEAIFGDLMECMGAEVEASRSGGESGHDRVVNGHKIEVKGSFMWGKGGDMEFRWSQIRDQDYDYLAVLAFYPDRVEMYYCDHDTVMKNLRVQDKDGNWIYNQHGGKSVDSGTYWISGQPEDFPWLKRITPESFPKKD